MGFTGANGQGYQLGTIDMQIAELGAGFSITSAKKISYGTGAKHIPFYNSKGKRIGWTLDKEEVDSPSVTILLAEWKSIKEKFTQQFPTLGIFQRPFDWTLTYGNSLSTLLTDKLEGVIFEKEGREASDDQGVIYVDLPLFILHVHPHGGDPVNYDAPVLP